MINNGLITHMITKDEWPGKDDPLMILMRKDPLKYMNDSTDEELVHVFPICTHCLSERYEGNVQGYREELIRSLQAGTITFEIDPEFN